MRRLAITCLTLVAAALPVVSSASAAPARANASATAPSITRVLPMRVRVGALLTIRGRHFKAARSRNTVIFRSPDRRTAFAKPRRASRTRLVVAVPAAVARIVASRAGGARPTRFRLRVLAGRFSRFTPRRLSPVVVPASPGLGGLGGGGGTTAPCVGEDYDGDLLSNAREAELGLDPCLADTDRDSVEDGYEYQSARDLNASSATSAAPYPDKRPYANPLDPSDGTATGTDYDGDGLTLRDEFLLWLAYSADGVRRSGHPQTLSNLVYSDGLQQSRVVAAEDSTTLNGWALDIDRNRVLYDDERDADADGLGNWDEVRGRMTEAWWPAQHNGTIEPKESVYPGIDFLDNEDTAPSFNAHADPDMDGDGVLDGRDDNDHDGLSNQFEVSRPDDWQDDIGFDPSGPASNEWAYVNPFNPCKPFNSERCHAHPPFGYYDGDGPPEIGPPQPGGTPPVTPDG